MANKVHLVACGFAFLFLVTGCLELGFSLIARNMMDDAPTRGEEAIRHLIYQRLPLTAGIANGAFIIVTFLLALPALTMPNRGLLKMAGGAVTFCGLFSLCVGVYIWVMTLRIRGAFEAIYRDQEPDVHDLVQSEFNCCGYANSSSPAFVTNQQCPSPAAAALIRGCSGPVSQFATVTLDNLFTALFGMVGIHALFIVTLACLHKDRKERERYRHIDEKSGFSNI
ncbi:hypothetical protein B0I35DRAFT_409638 [Stachybotrys elegans]|uniref:Tetraspanin n=1 Tax=Stachybotrys elegans TaxID=80388 RepID=A0A8K0SU56_9HYPO|nr:hypothetical protein B0I35DRAFT_409638 [Stachybotrys elegans]